jgi:hypothetical protein
MRKFLVIVCILIFSITAVAQTRVALVVGPRSSDVIFMSEREAEQMHRKLSKHRRTESDERLFAALTIALGVRPIRPVQYDCRRLTWSERNRMTCGSRYELAKCRVRR